MLRSLLVICLVCKTFASSFLQLGNTNDGSKDDAPDGVSGLAKLRTAENSVTQEWPRTSWKSQNFSTSVLKYEKTGQTTPGMLFYGIQSSDMSYAVPVIMKDDGELIWQGQEQMNTSNVKLQEYSGQTFLTMWSGTIVDTVGRGYGAVHIYDHSYKEVYRFCDQIPPLVTYDNSTYPCYIDSHESEITARGTILVTAYNITRLDLSAIGGSSDGWIVDCLFYEIDIKSSNVVFRWSSLEHLDSIPLSQSYNYLNLTEPYQGASKLKSWDYFHINSVTVLEDGYLVNARHTWSFYKIRHDGSVEWRVNGDPSNGGDFQLDKNITFSWQHDARPYEISDTHLLVTIFDDNNTNFLPVTSPSSGQLLYIDEDAKHVSLVQKYQNPEDPVLAPSQGNFQIAETDNPENSNGIIGYGAIPIIKEFDSNGHQVYSAQFGNQSDISSYRSFKYEWKAIPYWQAQVYAERVNGSLHVWASWNGATEYDSWKILVGDTESDLEEITSGSRNGFETEFILSAQSEVNFVKAIALLDKAQMSQSCIVRVSL